MAQARLNLIRQHLAADGSALHEIPLLQTADTAGTASGSGSHLRLAGKVALVTGAGSGIGRASARLFAQQGAKVIAVDWSEDGAKETVDVIRKAGGDALALQADAGDEFAMTKVFEQAVQHYKRLDVVFANAGVASAPISFEDQTVDEWNRIFKTNVIGVFLAIKLATKQFRAQKSPGSIIATASVAGIRSGAGPTDYSASKAAVINIVQTTSNQLAGTGIRVNAICPGIIETGMTQPMFDMARERGTEKKIGQLNALRRAGAPDEVAALALFLASDDSSYVNGQHIAVDGGLSSSHPVVLGRMH